jgi:hypothetical protein
MGWQGLKLKEKQEFYDFVTPDPFLEQGQITSFTSNSITDNLANWEIDEFKNKVVKICYNDINFYAVVESNTSDTLIFDDLLEQEPELNNNYCILHTLDTAETGLNIIVAVVNVIGESAILLQKSTIENERQYLHAYIERIENNNYCCIMSRKLDRQFGSKYSVLEGLQEGIRVYAHQLQVPHWDIIQTINIKRFFNGYFDTANAINTTEYTATGLNITKNNSKRFFMKELTNVKRFLYTDLVQRDFNLNLTATIEKTGGGGGECTVTFAIYRDKTEIIEILENSEQTTRFAGGAGFLNIVVNAVTQLNKNDYIYIVTKRDSGVFFIAAGSTITINEI